MRDDRVLDASRLCLVGEGYNVGLRRGFASHGSGDGSGVAKFRIWRRCSECPAPNTRGMEGN